MGTVARLKGTHHARLQDGRICLIVRGRGLFWAAMLSAASMGGGGTAWGAERAAPYVEALNEHGMADLSLEYLDLLVAEDRVPPELQDKLDYVYGMSLLAFADASAGERAEKLRGDALARLTKFRESQPKSDLAIDARGEIASLLLKRAQGMLAATGTDPQRRTAARQLIEQASKELDGTLEQYSAALASVRQTPREEHGRRRSRNAEHAEGSPRERSLESRQIGVELQRAMADYLAGLAYDRTKPKEKEASDARLRQAAASFDDLFQRYRATGSLVASLALLWQGRVYQELGDMTTAEDMYREILAGEPANMSSQPPYLTDLYLRTRLFWAQAKNASRAAGEVIDDRNYSALLWIEKNPRLRRAGLGLGIQLELAKAYLARAEGMKKDDREAKRLRREAADLLDNYVCRYPSEFMAEGFELRRLADPSGADSTREMASFEAAVTAGRLALGGEDWTDAISSYESALKFADRETDADALADARYRLAYAHLRAGQPSQAARIATEVARQEPPPKVAAESAGLALSALWREYRQGESPETKTAAAKSLEEVAKLLDDRFPRTSQADNGRYLRATLLTAERRFDEAAAAYATISKESPFYAESLLRAGQCYWAGARAQGSSSAGDEKSISSALAMLQASIDAFAEEERRSGQMPVGLVESKLRLAEVKLATDKAKEASDLLVPLVDGAVRGTPPGVERFAVDLFVLAVESAMAAGSIDQADRMVDLVLSAEKDSSKSGGDRLTGLLVQLGRRYQERITAFEQAGDQASGQQSRQRLEQFLQKISQRAAQSVESLRYIGDAYLGLGEPKRAAEIFARAAELASSTNTVPADQRSALVRGLRLRQAAALSAAEESSSALALVDALLAAHEREEKGTFPLALAEQRARILSAWSRKDPAQIENALAAWAKISDVLRAHSEKPASYFSARLAMAQLLQQQGKMTEAARTLKSTLALHPTCGGAEMKSRFVQLLAELERSPAPGS